MLFITYLLSADNDHVDTTRSAFEHESVDYRKSLRRRVVIPCELKHGEDTCGGQLLDLSEGGAFVQTAELFSHETVLSINFSANIGEHSIPLSLKAKVVYVGRFLMEYSNFRGFGVQFIDLSSETSSVLSALLDSLHFSPQRKYELT